LSWIEQRRGLRSRIVTEGGATNLTSAFNGAGRSTPPEQT